MKKLKVVQDLPRGGHVQEYVEDRSAESAYKELLQDKEVTEVTLIARKGGQIVAAPMFDVSEIGAPMEEQRDRMILLLIEATQLLIETLPPGHPLAEPKLP